MISITAAAWFPITNRCTAALIYREVVLNFHRTAVSSMVAIIHLSVTMPVPSTSGIFVLEHCPLSSPPTFLSQLPHKALHFNWLSTVKFIFLNPIQRQVIKKILE